jgi:hypothetical protein
MKLTRLSPIQFEGRNNIYINEVEEVEKIKSYWKFSIMDFGTDATHVMNALAVPVCPLSMC